MLILLGLIFIFMILFMYSACVVSGRCSREEERQEIMRKFRGVK